MRIPTSHIEPELEATERYGAICELLDRLVHAGAIPRKLQPAILDAFLQREEIMSTGIGFKLAIPHITSPWVLEPVFAFGRSHTGIDFDSLDGLPVEFVFLFILPVSGIGEKEQLRFKARVCRSLANRHTQDELQRCKTAQDLSAALRSAFDDDDLLA
ncbi:MAG: PTS sugar transporter subunit IIA [Verrucomicrobiaceae bacterium]|nr:MAG: PTS sugar transporter subunit IIA [Verrucomicrobiaceae bacterium]